MPGVTEAFQGKIMCVGLNRTGTTSLAVALSYLGFYTIHDAFEAKLKVDRARHAGLPLLSYLDEYDAFADLPFYRYFRELDTQYPRSFFVLTRRDPAQWARSRMRLDEVVARILPGRPSDEPRIEHLNDLEQFAEDHQRDVEAYFRGRPDFLSLDVCAGDGWDKLCTFLGVETPEQPFPRKHAIRRPPDSRSPRFKGNSLL